MKEKIVQLMKSEGLTSSRLADILGIQPSGISHLVSGRNKPSFELLKKILRSFPNINPYWLLLDDDKMYRSAEQPLELSSDIIDSGDDADAVLFEQDLFTTPAQYPTPTAQRAAPSAPRMVEQEGSRVSSNIESSGVQLTQVILLYSDGSCRSYFTK